MNETSSPSQRISAKKNYRQVSCTRLPLSRSSKFDSAAWKSTAGTLRGLVGLLCSQYGLRSQDWKERQADQALTNPRGV